jgi:hypothetical protein
MRRIVILVIGVCSLLMACKHPTVFKEVQSAKNLFTIEVPANMNVSNNIMPGASDLEYRNDSVPMYVLAFDTSRNGLNETTLLAFYDSAESHITIDSATLDQPKFGIVNGDSVYTSKLTGSVNGIKFVYRIEAIATPQRFFLLVTWTKADNEKNLREDMDKILNSFHDINHVKV